MAQQIEGAPGQDAVPEWQLAAWAASETVLQDALGDTEPQTAEEWNMVISDIDMVLVSAIAARVQATQRQGQWKAGENLPAVDLRQERDVVSRASEVARWMGIEETAVSGLMLTLMNTARRQQYAARQPAGAQ